MKLQLTRSISAFDTETTGTKVDKDKIVEICIIKVHPDGQTETLALLLNPEQPIPAEATKVHHITDEMVKDKPTFKQMASTIFDFIENTDFLTFNGNKFDIPLLVSEFERAGMPIDLSKVEFVDVSEIYREFNQRTLVAAVKQYCNRDIENAHSAQADTQATIDLLDSLIDTHGDKVPLTVHELALKATNGKPRLDLAGKFAYRWDDLVVFTFGKHKDEPINTNVSYLKWMQTALQPDGSHSFSLDTRNVIAKLLVHAGPLGEDDRPSKPTGFSNGYTNVR